ncbi:hypothetical protein DMENIID0001_046140 [Sergentomyia squamirostris]
MGLKVRAEKVHEDYLETLAKSTKFRIGFLLGGLIYDGKYNSVVVHMAPLEIDDEDETCETIFNVSPEEIVLRAINLVRMLPGGLTVLGLFLVNANDVFSKDDEKKKLREIVGRIQEEFRQNQHLKALQGDGKDFLILTYASGNDSNCQEIHTGNKVDFEFSTQKLQWRKVEMIFEIDEELSLKNDEDSCNVAANLRKILENVAKKIEEAKEISAGAAINPEETIDDIIDKKSDPQALKDPLNLLFRSEGNIDENVSEIQGEMVHLTGVINSRVFTPSGTKLTEVMKNMKTDLIRSLEARLQLYCDSLTDENVTKESWIDLQGDTPRRVYFTVQPTGVQFSDYLFSDENDDTVRENVAKMLDINLEPTDIFLLAEQPPDDETEDIGNDSAHNNPDEAQKTPRNPSKILANVISIIMAVIAIIIGLIVLQQTGGGSEDSGEVDQ